MKDVMKKSVFIVICFVFVSSFIVLVNSEALAKREGEKLEITVVGDLLTWTKRNLDINESAELEAWEELANVEITYITPPHSNYRDKVNMMMATGNLPDVVWLQNYTSDIQPLLNNNLLVPLTEYWDSPAAQKVKDMYYSETSLKPVMVDGEIWGIPLPQALYAKEGTMIRKDWLDNLGLDKPETLEEYREVLNAFTYDDPDGNGKDDTYGFTCRKELTYAFTFNGAFGIDDHRELTYDLIDGKIVPQQIQDKYRDYLEYMRTLIYEDKVFVPDAAINTSDQWKKDMFTSRAGMWAHSTTRIDQFFMANMMKANPDWKERGIEIDYTIPPLDPEDGKGSRPMGLDVTNGIYITRAAKNPEAVFNYIMWTLSDPEALEFAKYGLEGKHHKVVNGKREWVDGVFEDELQWQVKELAFLTKRVPIDEEEVRATYGDRALEAFKLNEKYTKPANTLLLGKPFLSAEEQYLSTLNTLVTEYSLKIMLGDLEVESGFEEMKKELNKNGLNKVVEDIQRWYDESR